MRLSIITSSLIALGAAAPAFQGHTTHVADLRSPVHIIKRGSETTAEERHVTHSGDNNNFPGSPLSQPPSPDSPTVLEARVHVPQSGSGSPRGHKRDVLEARVRVPQSGSGSLRGHKRDVLEARVRVPQSGSGSLRGHKRDVEARGNWNWPANQHGNGAPHGNAGFPQGNTGKPQGNSHQFQQPPANFQQPPANFQGNQFDANNNPALPQNTETETANIQINGGQSTPVPMGQLTTMNANGPITSLSTDKGNCMPIKPATGSSPAQLMSKAAFSAGNPINANSIGSLSQANQILLWCQRAGFDASVL